MFRFLRETTCGEKRESWGSWCTFAISLFVVFPPSSKQTDGKTEQLLQPFIFRFEHLLKMFKFHLDLKLSPFSFSGGESERSFEFRMGSVKSPVTGSRVFFAWRPNANKDLLVSGQDIFYGVSCCNGKLRMETDRNLSSTIPGLLINPNKH